MTGPDPLGELPREPRQHEAHEQLRASMQGLQAADSPQELTIQLEAAQQRLRVAENDYWGAQRDPGPAAVGEAERQVEAAEKTLARLDEADAAERQWQEATQRQAATAGELARAQIEAENARRRDKAVKQGVVDQLQAQRERETAVLRKAVEVAATAAVGVPPAGARQAAGADAMRTLARARELIAQGAEERARRAAEVDARRVATEAALRQAQQQVENLQARGAQSREVELPRAVEIDDQRGRESDRDRDIER